MLELEQLHYAPATSVDPILNGIQLRASAGRPVLIAGASGSGKTSLLEIISGLAACRTGTIRWQSDALTQRQRRSLCGIVFQFPERHFLGLTVQQELKLGHRRLPGERLEQVLQQVGWDRSIVRWRRTRSGGQQRRLPAVQLLRGAEVLLDEPTAGLDWSVRDDVLDLLSALSKERVLIVVTHEPEFFETGNATAIGCRTDSSVR